MQNICDDSRIEDVAYVLLSASDVELAAPTSASLRDPNVLLLAELEAPVAVCSSGGELLLCSLGAQRLFSEAGIAVEASVRLPQDLWDSLGRVPHGHLVHWVSREQELKQPPLAWARYVLQDELWLLLVHKSASAHGDLSLQTRFARAKQRLMVSIAHDVRSSINSIMYSADFLQTRGSLKAEIMRETLRDIGEASRRLQLTVDGLLDYARVGPAIEVAVSVSETLNRAHGLLRSYHRDKAHRVVVDIQAGAEWMRGNPVVIEDLIVNLLLAVAAQLPTPCVLRVLAEATPSSHVRLTVGVEGADCAQSNVEGSADLRFAAAQAELAAASQGGFLQLLEASGTARVIIQLRRSEGPR